jgi:hypothetical protein
MRRYILVALVGLLPALSYADALTKIRAKQLSDKRDDVNYVKIKTKKDLEDNKDKMGLKVDKDVAKSRNIINYVEIENTKAYDRGNFQRDGFHRGVDVYNENRDKNNEYQKNVGIVVDEDTKLKGKVTNIVDIKNSQIDTKENENLNIGVSVKGAKSNNVEITNKVHLQDSKIGGN